MWVLNVVETCEVPVLHILISPASGFVLFGTWHLSAKGFSLGKLHLDFKRRNICNFNFGKNAQKSRG